MAVKIKSYRLGPAGSRGLKIGLPRVWLEDVGLKAGDKVAIYRDEEDRLILQKEPKTEGQEIA